MPIKRPKPLFRVASEFNVTTQSIVDTLQARDLEAANRPNFKVTPEMFAVLEEVYGEDKAKSQEHERSREEYESRRSQMMNSRNESITLDTILDPIDALEPIEESLQPEGLEPVDDPVLDLVPEETVSEVEAEPETALEPEVSEPSVEVEAQDEVTEVTEAISEPEPQPEEVVRAEPEEEEAPVAPQPETVTEEAPELVTEAEPEPVVAADVPEEEPADVVEDSSSDQTHTDEPVTGEAPSEEKAEETESSAAQERIIRAQADKLKGTKVLGKASFTNDLSAGPKRRTTRKRRKDRTEGEGSGSNANQKTGTDNKQGQQNKGDNKRPNNKTNNKKKKPAAKKPEVAELDVDKMMRETLKKMQSSSSANVGSKRAKRRRQRKEEREEEMMHQAELDQLGADVVEVTEFITANDLAEELGVSVNAIISACMSIGLMVTINQRLDASTIELVAGEFDKEVKFVDAEEITEELEIEEDAEEDLADRAPIITVMGHVDHGKTSLLDYIRNAKVAEGEAGGITQHVGAYEVVQDGRRITFLDTPGHEAFTAMRSRGAQATDIVILVVAADDSVMPQTIEAINHAKAAGVPLVVAINKIDKPGSTPDKIKQQLSDHDVIVEDWGGTVQYAAVSAKTGQGIDELLEKVLIEAELLELKANPVRRADGVVLEARLDKGKGIVANVLVQGGTLNVGDPFVAGPCYGRVRAMEDDRGNRITSAGPSKPVQLMGFDDMPQAGDKLVAAVDEKTAKEVANQRQQIRREQAIRKTKHMTLDDLSRRLALGEVNELNIILKADVDGSLEALSGQLQKLSNDEVAVSIIHTGAGAISESDVLLASASDAIIIGFQVRPTAQARKLAETEEIDIRLFSVIYDAVDEVKDALEGLLSPEIKEQMMGVVDVREIFKVSKVGTIAGCYVTEGRIDRNNPIRIIREGVVIYEGEIAALKRFKEDVKEVTSGYECGISIRNYNDIKVGDSFESFKLTEEKRTLEDAN
ncbi:MAG: translation initiation factor IF-2 [Bacteroidota bacterium]